jgi:2-succinyl-5-enolpyruvyl-6-hydroxy-3-cyclohexene-1-carboxylate synthase
MTEPTVSRAVPAAAPSTGSADARVAAPRRGPGAQATARSASPTPAGPLRALVRELVLAGVRHAVICPGSRSTPLALALTANPQIRSFVHFDERAACFFALGLAKAARRAVAVVATSGTAVVNFAPAVVEAREGRVPLLVLTADRPPELRDRGAPQTIDQVHLYGRQVKWYAELPVPETASGGVGELLGDHLRGVIGRAVATAEEAPAGPVHLNLPFREPLVPEGDLQPTEGGTLDDPFVRLVAGDRVPSAAELDQIADKVRQAHRGLIVCGPIDRPGLAGALAGLAEASGFPIVADGLANVRVGRHDRSHVIARHDAIVRSESFRSAHRPDLVLRFGGTPTSRALLTMLTADGADQIVVDDGGWNEPTVRPATIVHAEPVGLARALADRLAQGSERPGRGADRDWLESWLNADEEADRAIRDWLAGLDEPFEGAPFAELAGTVPDGALVFVGSSMPVRDLDAFLAGGPAQIRYLGNRGANGIDGVVSAALGAAAADVGPLVLVVGDLSFLHDLNALVAARLHRLSATIVLINNDGGGIFSFLPQAETDRPEVGLPEHFELLFGTPHGIDFGPIVTALGGEHRLIESQDLGNALSASIGRPGVRVLELRTERRRNVELHRACVAAVNRALDARAH